LVLTPKNIVNITERMMSRKVLQEYLFIWRGFLGEDATWEGEKILHHPDLELLEDK
jgi:hypothetical protein